MPNWLKKLFRSPEPFMPPNAGAVSPARPSAPPQPHDEAHMRRALDLAREAASAGETPVGAVVVETATGRVLAEAHNLREKTHDPAGHAELIAMRRAAEALGDWRLTGCTLYVTLEPCPMCAGLIVQSRLGRLVYGAPDPKAGAVGSLYNLCDDRRFNHRLSVETSITAGVGAAESAELLKDFFRELRKRRR
jgi:tRNA(adenine34) deaminase